MADFHIAHVPWQFGPAIRVGWWARLGDAKKHRLVSCRFDGRPAHISSPAARESERLSKSLPQEEVMPTLEAQLRQDLRDYAVELRQLAYTLPGGLGEHDLLGLSGRMRARADQREQRRSGDDG